MSPKQSKDTTQDQFDTDEEKRLDEDFKEQVTREVENTIKEDDDMKVAIFTHTDMRSYLEYNGMSNLFKNLSVDFIINNF